EARYLAADHDHFECELRVASGELVPVEVTVRASTSGEFRRVYAVRDLRERRAAEERMRQLANHDTLTGLANRTAFNELLDRDLRYAARDRGGLAVLCLDLDRFKEINDVFGYQAGDRLLAEVAKRMSGALKDGEILARLGSDEFAAIQSSPNQPQAAADLARRLTDALGGRIAIDGQFLEVGASVGIALYPADGTDSGHLLANADVAMYRAKAGAPGTTCFFKRDTDDAVRKRRMM